jgi:7,8-dihydroneopterin aldolase/epimerase/oxygenase
VTEVEVHGLEIFGHHGALESERKVGQTFVFDVLLRLADGPASDDLSETVDYREVVARVQEVSDRVPARLLETLAAAVADELMAAFPLEGVRVRVRKPAVRLERPVAYTAATVERP